MNQIINFSLEWLNSVGQWFCGYAAGMFVQSSVLIVLLLVVDFLLRKRVRAVFRYCVWMLVFVKLILPPTLSLPTGIGYWYGDYLSADSPVLQQISNVARPEPVIAPAPEDFALAVEIPQGQPSQINPQIAAPVTSGVSGLNALTWQAFVFGLWLVGVLVISVLLVQRMLFVKGLIAQSEPAKSRLPDVLNQCRRKVGIRRNIELRLTNNISCPAVCGLFKPVILIPAALLEKLSPDRLRAVLVHELVHIKRADIWVNLVQTVLQIIYFYNPFVWLANAVIRRIREQAVDEMVLVALGAGAKNYSNTLIDIAEMAFWKTSLSLRLIGVVESKKALHRRIKHMLNRPIPKSAKLGVVGLLVVVIAGAVLLPMAKAEKTDVQVEGEYDNNLYQKQGSIRYALEFIGTPEELIDTTFISKHGQLANPRQLEFANKLFSLRKSKDVDMFISLLSDGTKKQLNDDNNKRMVHHHIRKIKDGTFLCGEYDFKFFATFREFTEKDSDTLKKHVSFAETPSHVIHYWHFHKPNYMLTGGTYYLIEDEDSYKIVPETLLHGEITRAAKKQKPSGPKEYGIVTFKQTDNAYAQTAVWKYHWNIELSPDVSENNTFQILKTTKVVLGQADLHPEIAAQKIIDESIIEKYKYDILKCRFYVGDSEPRYNYRKYGRQLSGWAYGFSIASWSRSTSMLFPGKDVTNVKPNKQGNFIGSDLQLISFETSEENIRYEHKVILRKDDSPEAKSAALLRLEQMTRRRISNKKLQYLDRILTTYANDHNSEYPDRLDQIKSYDTDEWLDWLLENIEYLGKGKTLTETSKTVIAYDKTLLEKAGSTNVLFNDGPVQYCNPNWLKKIGITVDHKTDVQIEVEGADIQAEQESSQARTVLLPDFDSRALMLDLASGKLLDVPKADTEEQMGLAIEKLGKGDLVFDASSLILVRGATTQSLSGDITELFKTYEIGQRLPEILNIKTKEGIKYVIEINSIDKDGCQLHYYPLYPDHYISASPLNTFEHTLIKQVLELAKQVEEKYPDQATHWPAGAGLYHVDAQGQVTVWHYRALWRRSSDCAPDEVGWGSSELVNATGMYYLPNGTPLQSRWRERGGGMKDIRVNIGRTVGKDERVPVIHRHRLASDRDLLSRDGRKRKIEITFWKELPLAIVVRLDKPVRLGTWGLGVNSRFEHHENYDQLVVIAPPGEHQPMYVYFLCPDDEVHVLDDTGKTSLQPRFGTDVEIDPEKTDVQVEVEKH